MSNQFNLTNKTEELVALIWGISFLNAILK